MNEEDLKHLTLRTGLLVKQDFGYLLAFDPATEEDTPHTKVVVLHHGRIAESWVKFNAHSMCAISQPSKGIVVVSSDGVFALFSSSVQSGNLFQDAASTGPHYGSIRSVSSVDGQAYAVGLRASAFHLSDIGQWAWMGTGLAADANLEAIHGFDSNDLYAVGFKGALWHFDGRVWSQQDLPTNVNLRCVICGGDGLVYAGGQGGMLLRGKRGSWEILDQENAVEGLWDLDWFDNTLFASSLDGVYRLDQNMLLPEDFGTDKPHTTYHLTSSDGVLWSVGENDVMAFDGTIWGRVI